MVFKYVCLLPSVCLTWQNDVAHADVFHLCRRVLRDFLFMDFIKGSNTSDS